MTPEERTLLEERIVDVLKTVYDPEIPVDIYNLGLIYRIEVNDDATVDIDMTFTAPTCPAAESTAPQTYRSLQMLISSSKLQQKKWMQRKLYLQN